MSFPRYERHKESGVEWLGEVPEHWKIVKLRDAISALLSGGTPDSNFPAYWSNSDEEEQICWVSISDMSRNLQVAYTERQITPLGLASKGLSILPVGTLLYSIYASLGKVALLMVPAAINQAILGIVPNLQMLTLDFLRYWLNNIAAHLEIFSSSNTQDNLNAGKVRSFPLVLPPVSEQKVISFFLNTEVGKIDALIEEQRRLIELLKEKRQAVISHAVTKGLDLTAGMRETGIGWIGSIPMHWEVVRLVDLIRLGSSITYGIVQAGPDIPNGVPYIRTSDLAGEDLPIDGYLRTSSEIDFAYRRSKVNAGDLVIALRSSVGKALIVPAFLDGANLTQGTAKFSPSSGCDVHYVGSFLNTVAQSEFEIVAKGATFKEVTLDKLRRIAICCPPLSEQVAISKYVAGELDAFRALEREALAAIHLLQERRSALISSAVTGKIDVRNYEKQNTEEAA